MKENYSSEYQTTGNCPVKKEEKRWFAFFVVLLCLFAGGQQTKAISIYNGSDGALPAFAFSSESNTYGFITLDIPVYEDDNNQSWVGVQSGKDYPYLSVGSTKLLEFYVEDGDGRYDGKNPVTIKVRPTARGAGRIAIRTSDGSYTRLTDTTNFMTLSSSSTSISGYLVNNMRVRYYPETESSSSYSVWVTTKESDTNAGITIHNDIQGQTFTIGSRSLVIPTPTYEVTLSSGWEFSTSKKMKLHSTINTNSVNDRALLAYVKWDGDGNTYQGVTYTGGSSTSNIDITLDDNNLNIHQSKTIRYYWKQDVADTYNPLYKELKSGTVTIPAYNQANSFAGTYNQTTGEITLTWSVNTSSQSNANNFVSQALGGDFEIQRSANSTFTQDVKSYTVTFEQNKTGYTLTDAIPDLSNNGTFYYRIRRTKPTTWSTANWDNNFFRNTTVTGVSHARHATVSNPDLTIDEDKAEVTITWTPESGYWSTGSKVVIEKYNETTKATLPAINLTAESDFNAGKYTDIALSLCNEYSYKIYVDAGQAFFTNQTPIAISKHVIINDIGEIKHLKVSKGYYSDRTSLEWNAVGSFDEFIIKRVEYGESTPIQIATVPATLSEDYSYDDVRGIAGIYYTYIITGVASCNNKSIQSNEVKDIGFRAPTGNIYGRITFSNGQPVGDVEVLLSSDLELGYSMNLKDNIVLSVQNPKEISNENFTFQSWVMSESASKPNNQLLFYRNGQYEVGFDASGDLYFKAGEESISSPYEYEKNQYIHISAVKKEQTLQLYVDSTLIKEEVRSGVVPSAASTTFYLGSNGTGNRFIGYLDEVRIWNRALEKNEIKRDYTRFIVGNEADLTAYYRFNEKMENAFYDISYIRTKYNENHGTITNGYTNLRSDILPEKLELKGITDSSGDYYINGVPYEGNGTQYKVIPRKGTHQFDPEYRLRNLSDKEQTVEANFTNKSSFSVSGAIYYKDTNIPVQGIGFKIDGIYVSDGKGGMAQTNANGIFTIDVPVGVHMVEAVKDGHIFNNEGKILYNGADIDYQNHMSGIEIWDETKVRFIGRIAGGSVQESYPIGHSLSTNNLGDNPVIKLTLETDAYKLNTTGGNKEINISHFLPSNKSGEAPLQTKMVHEERAIYIYPDEKTGEFFVDLIPYKFVLDSLATVGHKEILSQTSGGAKIIDLQNSVIEQKELYEYTDSIAGQDGKHTYISYSDTVKFHYKEQYIKRVAMEIDFYQINKKGSRAEYFGEEEVVFSNMLGDSYTVPTYENGSYLFKNNGKSIPIYLQGHQYNYIAVASEVYRYNGLDEAENRDRVPCIDGSLIIANRLAESNTDLTLKLNAEGYAVYSFVAGLPDMGSTGTKTFSARIRLSNNEEDTWRFEGENTMNACIIGSQSKGSDFVTNGPNQLITVLRDPPGSNSFAYLEQGTVISSSSTTKHGVKVSGEEDIRAVLSPEFKSAAGTPFFLMITEIKLDNNIGAIVSHEESSYDGETRTKKTTLQTRFETSSDPLYVGRDGDVLIGNSTNIVYGVCDAYIIVEGSYDLNSTEELMMDAGTYKLIRRSTFNSDVQFNTLFAYPQIHIEARLIPELTDLKNSYLKYGAEWTPAAAQSYANTNNEIVYVSHLSPDEEEFGYSNNDDDVFGSRSNGAVFKADGPSYAIYYPVQMPLPQRTDTIFSLCSSIDNWYDLLAKNEEMKLKASKLHSNYSFHAGSLIEYSEEYSFETEASHEFDYFVGASAVLELGATFDGIGFKTSFTEGGFKQGSESTSDTEEHTRKEGFVLAEDGDDDYLSVDVFYEESLNIYEDDGTGLKEFAKGPFVYRTRGGVTSCPYEGARLTRYYQPGTVLDEATVKLEVPVLNVNQNSVVNVPQTRPAVFTLFLENQSEAKEDNYFRLAVLDGTNPYGAKLSIDGQVLSNTGRDFLVPYGESLMKTLEFRVGADSMKYENVQLILRSQCQYDPTNFVDNIADTISISAYFIPSCSEIKIKEPLNNFIVNSKSPIANNIYQLPVVLNGYDVNNQSLDRIEIQMKQEDDSEWFIRQTYYADPTRVKNPLTEAIFDRSKTEIQYIMQMDGYDSRYQIRAVSICIDGADEIPTFSDIITGTKDTERPKLFGSPQPANGILDIDGEVRINFNETIKEGALSKYNFQVTGIKNGANKTHGVSVEFDGVNDYLTTEAERNLIDRDLTVEMWVYREKGSGSGTLFSHGATSNSLEFGFTADDYLTILMNGNNLTSNALPFENGTQWAHVAMVYNASNETVSLFYNTINVLSNKAVGKYEGNGTFEFGRSMRTTGNYFNGKMHEARIWSKQLAVTEMKINWLKMFSGLESGMIAYYPMMEGKGAIVYDKVRGANAIMYAEWSTQDSRAVSFAGNGILNMPSVEISKEMDYTMEAWFKAEEGQTNATLLTNELKQADESIELNNANRFFLGFNENGKLMFRSNQLEQIIEDSRQTDYRDNNWHHVSISVNRITRRVEAFIDGMLIKQFSTEGVDGMSADQISAGAVRVYEGMAYVRNENHFKGSIDEVRFWNSTLTEDLISNNNNVRLNGNEMGLIAYYPFETYTIVNGITTLNYTLDNMAISDEPVVPSTATNVTEAIYTAPIKDRGPVENLAYSFVISDKSLIITLDEDMDVIEKSTVTFSVKELTDMFGNETVSPIIWSAYIDRNLLKWSTDEVNLSKKRNDALTFEADIVNSGGSIERFSLENLPVWLTASPMSGSISPKTKQTIKFVVNEGTNVGRYQESVFMRNSKNVVEMLGVNLRVEGEKPNWTVNPADYEYNMSVFGKLRINGLFSSDNEDMLAAFINGKCVGVTTNSYQEKTNTWYTFLTVYGNRDMIDSEIEFRIWDAGTAKTYGAETTQRIVFRNQQISGSAENPLIFDTSDLVFQNIALARGWNWISFNVANNSLSNVQATLQNGAWTASDIVKSDNHFDSYSALSKEWTGTLSANGGFNNTSMFMLNAGNAQTLSVIGQAIDLRSTPVTVKGNRWTYISYLPMVNMKIDDALADYDAKSGDIIKSQSAFSMFDGYTWVGSLSYLEPGKGYMMLREDASDTSFRYPVQTGSITRTDLEEEITTESNYLYAGNMTMTALVDESVELRGNDKIVALINNEVRGIGTQAGNGLNYLNIASDDAGTIEFVIERDGHIIARANTKENYTVNKVAGTWLKPVLIDFSKTEDVVSIHPNPFVTDLNINIVLDEAAEVGVVINDINGRPIAQWPVIRKEAGAHTITWNGGTGLYSGSQYIVTVTINGKPSSYKVTKK